MALTRSVVVAIEGGESVLAEVLCLATRVELFVDRNEAILGQLTFGATCKERDE